MATERLEFAGKVRWCRPDAANEWGKYNTRFYPKAPEDLAKMKALKFKNSWGKDEDGEYTNVSVRKEQEFRGRTVVNHVVTTDKEGNPWPSTVFIGDGSDVILGVDYYDHPILGSKQRGHAIKWTSLKVLNLNPYVDRKIDLPDNFDK